MAYNFMDKRLIQDGVEFLEDGCKKNDSVYDLFFELGYMHYDKDKNFNEAVRSYAIGATRHTTSGTKRAPAYVRHQLAHALEKLGDIDRAVEQWKTNLATSVEEEQEGVGKMYVSGPNTDAARHNLYITQRRRNERLAAVALREHNVPEAARLWQANADLAAARLREGGMRKDVEDDQHVALANVERIRNGTMPVAPPTDLGIHFTVTRIAPRKLRIDGTCNALNLSRVQVLFRDVDYDQKASRGLEHKMANCTMEWDSIPVKQEKFTHTLDLNRDPADMDRTPSDIYPLRGDQYELVLSYNPRLQAAFIQDRYGWNGEGIESKWLQTDDAHPGIMYGRRFPLRTVVRRVVVNRDDILGQGQKVISSG